MKKILALLLLSGLAAHADPFGDWWYYVINNEATITRYTGSGGAVTIPKKINGVPVKRVGEDSTLCTLRGEPEGVFPNSTSLTSITIPNSVICIGDNAFRGCTSLTSITIFDSVMSIGFSCPAHVNTDFDLLFRDSRTSWEWRTSLVWDVKELIMDPTWDAEKEAGEEAVLSAPHDVFVFREPNLIPFPGRLGREAPRVVPTPSLPKP